MRASPDSRSPRPSAPAPAPFTPSRLRRCAAALTLVGLGLGLAAPAAAITGQLNAQITLTSGCIIFGGPGTVSGANFGTLDFGVRPSTFIGTATAVATGGEGGGTTQVVCSPEVSAINIAVSPGNHAGQGTSGVGQRAMSNGSAFLAYDVYQDPAHTTPYPLSSAVTGIAVPVTGSAFVLPIYGLVNKTTPNALPAGTYTDQLQITLTF